MLIDSCEGTSCEVLLPYRFWKGQIIERFQKQFLVPINRVDVLRQCLAVVVRLAETLPIALVPEQLLVTTVRYDVIHHCSLGVPSQFHALHTQRMALEVGFARLLPPATVTSLGCGSCHLRVKR